MLINPGPQIGFEKTHFTVRELDGRNNALPCQADGSARQHAQEVARFQVVQ